MDQYTNLIKAVTSLLLLFFGAYVYKSCKEEPKPLPIPQQIVIKNEIIKTDSAINRIPFTYSDSERTIFLQNYSKFR
jgi:hypothetical protein